MSRGFGHVQRFVLAELDAQCALGESWCEARTLAGRLVRDDPSEASITSVRRAIRLLAAEGLVELASAGPRGRVIARIPPRQRADALIRCARRRRAGLVRSAVA